MSLSKGDELTVMRWSCQVEEDVENKKSISRCILSLLKLHYIARCGCLEKIKTLK